MVELVSAAGLVFGKSLQLAPPFWCLLHLSHDSPQGCSPRGHGLALSVWGLAQLFLKDLYLNEQFDCTIYSQDELGTSCSASK